VREKEDLKKKKKRKRSVGDDEIKTRSENEEQPKSSFLPLHERSPFG